MADKIAVMATTMSASRRLKPARLRETRREIIWPFTSHGSIFDSMLDEYSTNGWDTQSKGFGTCVLPRNAINSSLQRGSSMNRKLPFLSSVLFMFAGVASAAPVIGSPVNAASYALKGLPNYGI